MVGAHRVTMLEREKTMVISWIQCALSGRNPNLPTKHQHLFDHAASRKRFTRFTPQGRLDGGAMQGADATAWDAQHHLLGIGI